MRNEAAATSVSSGQNRRNLSGKLVLAAVVHQVTCNSSEPDEPVTGAKSNKCSSNRGARDAHADPGGGGGGLRRLGRLLFSRRRARQPTCFAEAANLIDSNNNDALALSSSPIAGANDTQPDEANGEQVIEFKFDLIVEDQLHHMNAGHRAAPNANQVGQVGGGDSPVEVGAGNGGWKLGESVDELVESFVFDSNDVCLMSLGRPAETVISPAGHHSPWRAAASSVASSAPGHFHYASSLAAHTLAYSFHLLDSAPGAGRRRDRHRQRQRHRQDQPHRARRGRSGGSESDDEHAEANHYSIELGATLFACLAERPGDDDDAASNRSSRNRFAIVDLLRNCDGCEQDNRPSQANLTVDCSSLEQALETLGRLAARLAQLEASDRDKRLLLFHLKLKQRINGGLFSNRMCVIDFQPKFTELHTILESIFNGQALAYLKRRQLHLRHPLAPAQLASLAEAEPKHHQVASLESGQHQSGDQQSLVLLEAEWALYKHLSAALIRTLVVVHVRRLAATAHEVSAREKRFADQLMLDNLCLLEFAHSIQRASAQRLRRRRRHLRSHLASSTTSVASNQSATTTTCLVSDRHLGSHAYLFGAGAGPTPASTIRNKSARFDGAQTGSRSLRSRCQRRAMDMGVLSRHHHHHRACHKRLHSDRPNLSGPELTGTESSSPSTTSSGSRRQDQQQLGHGGRLQAHRAQACPPANHTLSSSTDGRPYATATPLSLANTNININSDDSDSITSANLNSCSSVASYLLQQNSSARCRQQSAQVRPAAEPWSVTEVDRAQIELTSALNLAGACNGTQPQAFAGRRQTRASSVIQIDCPMTATSTTLTTSTSRWCGRRRAEDNASDIEDSSVVIAEPPKQLKLEEFLTQLSSIISPIRARPSTELTAARPNYAADGRQVEAAGGVAGEEDEDCKSHSSILEHLSSLALESNTKLNNRQQHHAGDRLTADVAKENDGPSPAQQVEQADDDENQLARRQPTTGHLQRLLNSSVQLQRKGSPRVTVLRSQHPADIEDRLRALSAAAAAAVSPSASSSSGVFAQSSSNCDSASSCGSSLSTAPPPPLPSLATDRQPDLYASVVNKHHSHIKT